MLTVYELKYRKLRSSISIARATHDDFLFKLYTAISRTKIFPPEHLAVKQSRSALGDGVGLVNVLGYSRLTQRQLLLAVHRPHLLVQSFDLTF